MPNFYQGLMLTAFLFCACFGIAFIARFITLYFRFRKEPHEQPAAEPKIYYVTKTVNPVKRKRKRRKKPDLALKGIVLKPEQLKDDADF